MTSFDLTAPPFDLLPPDALARLQAATDLVYFEAGSRPLAAGDSSDEVWVIHRGRMQALRPLPDGGEERLSDYGPGDVLGAFAVMLGRARFTYEAIEQTLCLVIPSAAFRRALDEHPRFAAWFAEGLAAKRQLLAAADTPSDLAELMLTRVADAELAPAVKLAASTSLADARRAMKQHAVSCVLVDDGIVTRTDLLDALALDGLSRDSPLAPLVRRPLVTVREHEVLFQALVTMTEHHVERVVVMRDGVALATLGMTEVLSHYSSHSHLIGLQLARAESVEAVRAAARRLPDLVRTLHAQGARMSFLTELVSALNGRVLRRLFELIVPAEQHPHLALLVLGSEGRREQIIRTDQDNALIIADGHHWPGLDAAMARLGDEITACGWPPCPGAVMVANPAWRHSVADWQARIAGWSRSTEPRALLDLAILIDARAVAGNAALLESLRPAFDAAARNDILLHHMARTTLEFATPLTLFGHVRGGEAGVDIKKGGIFPLVHGLRVLALAHGVRARNSFDRAEALVRIDALEAALGRDVQQALAVFLRLRLARQLDVLRAGGTPDNLLPPAALRRLDRELLRDALAVVDSFKAVLARRFHL